MTDDKGILIQNIYYMLTYAFHALRQKNYENVAAESFENAADLFAHILAKGAARQLKQGLFREYVSQRETLTTLRGKLQFHETLRLRAGRQLRLACERDEFTVNNTFNQILKTTMFLLIRERFVREEHRAALKKLFPFFEEIDVLDPSAIPWNGLRFQKNNQNYAMLVNVCRFVIEGWLQTTRSGSHRLWAFSDDNMARLFEKFVLEYFRRHHRHLKVSSPRIRWNLETGRDEDQCAFLPVMQSDILLRNPRTDKTLIIDTKYYSSVFQTFYNRRTFHSGNLYQIYTYVKNYDSARTGRVSGLLLYAKTSESVSPEETIPLDRGRIFIKTLDLNSSFAQLSAQLDAIVVCDVLES